MDIHFNPVTDQDRFTVSPTAFCHCEGLYHYQLISKKISDSGSSETRQTGHFQAVTHQETRLATTSFNLTEGIHFQITLSITDDQGHIITVKSLTHPK